MLLDPTARLQGLANDGHPDSLSHRLRERRFQVFERFTATLPRPLSIVDVGGTNEFWEQRGWAGRQDVEITLVNLDEANRRHENIVPTAGDATDMSEHEDGSFDVAFSNSVIEHLFTFENQAAMASEIRRVSSRAYWVQTPNFWFPVEPHFLVPAWHWLPEDARVAILRRRGVGWAGRCPDPDHARRVVEEHRLMRRRELARLFPDARIVGERFGGLVKSWTAVGTFAALDQNS
jgi:methyltransferase family protein